MDLGWFDQASCRGMDTSVFFLELGLTTREAEIAKAVCRGCPVIKPCLNYAINTDSKHGIFGGLSPKERRAVRWRRDAVSLRTDVVRK